MMETRTINELCGSRDSILPPEARIIFSSDIHLPGDYKSAKADFDTEKAEKYTWFLDEIVAADMHIIVGDLFENWQFSPEDIIKQNQPIIDRLIAGKTIFIKGNHDNDMLGMFENNRTCENLRHNGIIAQHGHTADILNSGAYKWIGRLITHALGYAEAAGFQLDQLYESCKKAKGERPNPFRLCKTDDHKKRL